MGGFRYLQSRVKRKAVVAVEKKSLYQRPADAKPGMPTERRFACLHLRKNVDFSHEL
jgi:hypothetical protein